MDLAKFAISKISQYLFEFSDHYWPKKLGDGLLDRTIETENGFKLVFTAKLKTFCL